MKTLRFVLVAASLAAIPALAQPVVNAGGVVNAASFIPQSFPNSGIAQGSVFSIFGTGLGPAQFAQASSFPLPTNLAGSSVAVTVNGTTVNAILFYTRANQINALMPSNTPTGTGTLTVTYNGKTSAPASVQVVANNVGIFTVASSGSGPGVLTNGNNQANSFTLAANPGEILNIWATGLGAISGPDDELPPTGNITANSPTVYIGGAQVTPAYHGRSGCCSGVDQIQIQIPQNVTGCNIPVAVQTGNTVSNFVSISVAASGRTCSDALTGLSGTNFQQFFAKGSASIGTVILQRSETTLTLPPPLGNGTPTLTTTDGGLAAFEKYSFSGTNINGSPFSFSNYGACSVFYYQASTGDTSGNPTGTYQFVDLDAGSPITINGPNGTKTMPRSAAGAYFSTLGADPDLTGAGPLYLSQGSYTISGPGGANVGPFSVNVAVPTPLNWTNQSSIDTVTRANGLPLQWTGGDPNGYVLIEGFSLTGPDTSNLSAGGFICMAKVSDQHFTVPPVVLLSVPPSAVIQESGFTFPTGNLSLVSETQPVSFTATGLDLGIASSAVFISKPVTFQ